MQTEDDLESWLQGLPLDEAVDVDGESVYLRPQPGGAELGACLISSYTQEQLHDAMKQGFQSVSRYAAGLGISADGRDLVLTQWLPDVTGWTEVADPLENLLNQLAMWRAALGPTKVQLDGNSSRNEQRLRMLFMGVQQ